jgi:hypothetical protein
VAKKAKQGITWTNERRKLSDLIPWERNPRTIKNAQAERLVDSVETFGQVETLAIDCDNNILNGHQRVSVLAGQYGMDYEVDVRVASRELTERERQQLTVYLHRGATGEWSFDELANWGIEDDLVTWGFDDIAAIAEAAQTTAIGESSITSTDRILGDKRKQIKPVLYADEIGDFEKAIIATGLRNRGEAIMTICRFYLEQHDNGEEEGQFNISFKNFATQKSAKDDR